MSLIEIQAPAHTEGIWDALCIDLGHAFPAATVRITKGPLFDVFLEGPFHTDDGVEWGLFEVGCIAHNAFEELCFDADLIP